MKTVVLISIFIFSLFIGQTYSQTLNWESLDKNQKHLLHANAGWEYSFVYGLAYGYHFQTKLPIVADVSFSLPSGEAVFDDFKSKIGGQINLYQINHFRFTTSIHGIYRRYENPLVTLQNFGADATAIVGYYKPRWFVAGEFGFDKAIVTHFKNSAIYKEVYPNAKDGWYEPATGGNFNFGLQAGYSFRRSDLTLRLGKTITQDFKTKPMIPLYFQLGYNFKLE